MTPLDNLKGFLLNILLALTDGISQQSTVNSSLTPTPICILSNR